MSRPDPDELARRDDDVRSIVDFFTRPAGIITAAVLALAVTAAFVYQLVAAR